MAINFWGNILSDTQFYLGRTETYHRRTNQRPILRAWSESSLIGEPNTSMPRMSTG